MTSQDTTTTTPAGHDADGRTIAAPPVRQVRHAPRRQLGSWFVWAAIAAALVAGIWLVVAGTVVDVEPVPSARANQAATDRLQGLADQYEAVRTSRANQAATDRLQGLADQYDAIRSTRASQAATERLQGLADRLVGTGGQ